MNIINQQRFLRQQKQYIRDQRANRTNLSVVISGGSRGLGRSLAEEFTKYGDNVCILARNQKDINEICTANPKIIGRVCDVSNVNEMNEVIKDVNCMFRNQVDIWINNAGISGGSRSLIELEDSKIEDIIKTNLLGTAIACKLTHETMSRQVTGGSIFNLAGAGSNGQPTPLYSVYGATKAGIVQLSKTLQKEWKDDPVDMHIISPGMMLTDLLVDNMNIDTLELIQFLCSHPDLVAHHIVPRMRRIYRYAEDDTYIKFLTIFKIITKFVEYKFRPISTKTR